MQKQEQKNTHNVSSVLEVEVYHKLLVRNNYKAYLSEIQ